MTAKKNPEREPATVIYRNPRGGEWNRCFLAGADAATDRAKRLTLGIDVPLGTEAIRSLNAGPIHDVVLSG